MRRADHADRAILRRFEQAIVAAERPFDSTIRKGDVAYYDLDALLASTDAFVVIAEAAGEAIGCAFARMAASRAYIEPAFHAYVGLIYVSPEHRGVGVSGQMLTTLKDWARRNGLTEMHLEVYPENIAAIRAYKKTGFAPYMLDMRLPVGGE